MEVRMNLKIAIALVVAATSAAAFAGSALAQSAGRGLEAKDTNPAAPSGQPSAGATAGGFAAMDRNNDGYISRDEARAAPWNTRFSELDKDNDGRVSQSEFNALGAAGTGGTQTGPGSRAVGEKPKP
jgi:hypothetical protein